MQIAIIGSGNVGTALAQALGRAGHTVVFGTRAPEPGKPDQTGIAEAVGGAMRPFWRFRSVRSPTSSPRRTASPARC